ncbi:MAG: nucleotidyltransferase family protein, partial [Bacteroidia bacterium]|nr:nucleotidyltransferase family protein [Bacteroidia bacterium]
VQFLEMHGTSTLLMNGIPLSLRIYKNYAVRHMAGLDILIPFSKARFTVNLLIENGWKLYYPQYLEYNLRYGRCAMFVDSENTELALHWHPIFEAHGNIVEEDFWSFAIPLNIAGVETKTFCSTDHLFHTIVHGLHYNPEPPIRWIADAYTLINRQDSAIDWDRLMRNTIKFRVHLQINEALNFLVTRFYVRVPGTMQHDLGQIKPTYTNRLVYRYAMTIGDQSPQSLKQKLYSVYAGFLRQTIKPGFWSQHFDFVRYMRFSTKG